MRTLLIAVFLVSTKPCLAHQSVRQEEGKPLLPPNLNGIGPTDLTGFNIASLCSIPLSGTIEAENSSTDAQGKTTTLSYHTKLIRDSLGRTRIDIDLNPEGARVEARLLGSSIFDAVSQTEITLTPFNKQAIRTRYVRAPVTKQSSTRSNYPIPSEPPQLSGLRLSQPQIDVQRQELGHEVINDLAVRHGCETIHYPAGFAGRAEPDITITDYWYSQELQAFVLLKRVGPGTTRHTLTLQTISRQEPEKSFFQIPRSYKIIQTPRQEWRN
jgi:hypothetical protein